MRVWDVAAGYLNRQSLLAEHRELHGLRSILVHGKKGYSQHPETLRWVGCLSGLAQRHELLRAEMELRGWRHATPVAEAAPQARWPASYVTPPGEQFALLKSKYTDKPGGRIPLPRDAQTLWAGHKYSVMARSPEIYRHMGRRVAAMRTAASYAALAEELVVILRERPEAGRLMNALEHMWGHVSAAASQEEKRGARESAPRLLAVVCAIALRIGEPFLLASTALGELAAYT